MYGSHCASTPVDYPSQEHSGGDTFMNVNTEVLPYQAMLKKNS